MLTRITDRKIPCAYIHVYRITKNWGPGPYNSLRHADDRRYFSGLSLAQNRRKTHMLYLAREVGKFGHVLAEKKVTLKLLMNSNIVKPETFDHLHLVYHFIVPLNPSLQNGNLKSKPIKVNSGILQGVSLSPLLFCLSLIPLSKELNRTGCGYNIRKRSINHLFCIDDLKVFAKDDNDLEDLLQTEKMFSDNIGISFGLDKCNFKSGKLLLKVES